MPLQWFKARATSPRRSQRKQAKQAEAFINVHFINYNTKLEFGAHCKHKRTGALERVPPNVWELIAP